MRAQSIIVGRDEANAGIERVGAKAHQLCALPASWVPEFFCVTTDAFDSDDHLCETNAALVLREFDVRFGPLARVAVRSSAVDEDSAQTSFAGALTTFLNVPREQLIQRVNECRSSRRNARAVTYREQMGVEHVTPAAVIVQRLVESLSSGVMFTCDPVTGAANRFVIESSFGLGEGVVAGRAAIDRYLLDADTGEIQLRNLAVKDSRVASLAAGGVADLPVPDSERSRASLSDAQIALLHALGLELRETSLHELDIEWAADADGSIQLLQVRPVTGQTVRSFVLDNANICESYPGLTLPLTFSMIRDAYRDIMARACQDLGVPPKRVHQHPECFYNLVRSVNGRVYYNLNSWYQMYRMVPGFESALDNWRTSIGLTDTIDVDAPVSESGKAAVVSARVRVGVRLIQRYRRLDSDVARYMDRLARVERAVVSHDWAAASAQELLARIRSVRDELMVPYAVSAHNDFFGQQMFGLCERLLRSWGIPDPRARLNQLAVDGDLPSVEPLRSAERIAHVVSQDPQLSVAFCDQEAEALWTRIRALDAASPIRRAFDDHIERFGFRTIEELKLETEPMRKRPWLLVASVQRILRQGALSKRTAMSREDVAAELRRCLKGHPMRTAFMRRLLASVRRSLCHRETLRMARARAHDVIRRLYIAAGHKLHALGLLAEPRHVFYLQNGEVEDALAKPHAFAKLPLRVAQRIELYRQFSRREMPGRILVRGTTVRPQAVEPLPQPGRHADLAGVPCSRGRVRGRALVVQNPETAGSINGAILVAATTDPAWLFLMADAKGLIVERGSLLSHTAIVGRELGIPTIVGVVDATKRIVSGQLIEMDADSGAVWFIEKDVDDGGELRSTR